MSTSPWLAITGAAIEVVVLIGYAFHLPHINRLSGGGPGIHPWTAISLLTLCGSAVAARTIRRSNASLALALLGGAIAAARVLAVATGHGQAFLDLAPFQAEISAAASAGIDIAMGIHSTTMLLLLSLALVLLRFRHVALSQITAAIAGLVPLAAFIGFFGGMADFYGRMSLPMILGGIFAAGAILLRTAHRPLLRQFLTRKAGGRHARAQLIALTIPFVGIALFAAWSGPDIVGKALPGIAAALIGVIGLVMVGDAYHAERVERRGLVREVPRSRVAEALGGAWERGEIHLLYQPQVELSSERIVGVEALVRWNDPVRGMISPAEFIPVAEATGLIVPLGAWILRKACAELMRWPSSALILSVNVSPIQLQDPGFTAMVRETLRETGLAPQRLVLEITENVRVPEGDPGLAALHALHAEGVRVAIDDFGTGYSSLSYIRRLPNDYLKIDRSFVSELPHQDDAAAIALAVVAMGRSLGKRIIAEGIETAEQARFLRDIWCDEGQGYLYAAPSSADAVRLMLKAELQGESTRPLAAGLNAQTG